jgi:hypothetical protein
MRASDYWPIPTAHQEHWEHRNNPYVYEYDPTDDGPECGVAKIILSTHTDEEIENERFDTRFIRNLDRMSTFLKIELLQRKLARLGELLS